MKHIGDSSKKFVGRIELPSGPVDVYESELADYISRLNEQNRRLYKENSELRMKAMLGKYANR